MLTPRQNDLWIAYEQIEARGTREAKLNALDSFLAALASTPEEEWTGWAQNVARHVVDNGTDIQIRMPLFRRAIFPALLAGFKKQTPGCARWLAGLIQHIYRCKDCQQQLPEDCQTETGLLHAALQHDTTDHASRERLVDAWGLALGFAIHEVPSGVLYGMDGATAEQCLELQEWLRSFVDIARQVNAAERYACLIEDCQFHFHAYREYLLSGTEYGSYRDYLSRTCPRAAQPDTGKGGKSGLA